MPTNYTLEELSDLEAALATGALRVTHGVTTTEYRNREDMVRQVLLMRNELGVAADSVRTPAIRRIRFLTSKGL